ncbi:hypothetical protein [Halomicrococcus sp. SG-WS-1]|uniref:hypothetical protein n=1 Tax=Halomicrococcus sp. SG-WS-1 TaxID=3439057 RepID=UPI003F7B02FB
MLDAPAGDENDSTDAGDAGNAVLALGTVGGLVNVVRENDSDGSPDSWSRPTAPSRQRSTEVCGTPFPLLELLQDVKRHRVAELGVVVLVYVVVFLLIIGPAIGAATGFDDPALDLTDGDGREIPTGVRGVVLVLTTAMVMVGYMVVRARVAGVSPEEYWGR